MGAIFNPPKPKTPEPVRMPDDQDPRVLEAKRKKFNALSQSGGRQSTDLGGSAMASESGPGPGMYSGDKLGQ